MIFEHFRINRAAQPALYILTVFCAIILFLQLLGDILIAFSLLVAGACIATYVGLPVEWFTCAAC